jgi:hypothetical protein
VISPQLNDPDIWILRSEKFQGVVGRGIIRNNKFHTGIGACQHGRNKLFQVFSTVKIDNDNRDFSQSCNELGNKKGAPKVRLWVVNDQ